MDKRAFALSLVALAAFALLALLGASTQCLAAPRSPGERWVDVSRADGSE